MRYLHRETKKEWNEGEIYAIPTFRAKRFFEANGIGSRLAGSDSKWTGAAA